MEVELNEDSEEEFDHNNATNTEMSGSEVSQDAADENEVTVSIGDEKPAEEEHQRAPEWVRELRKNHRELQRKNRELEERLKTVNGSTEKPVQLGKKPTLEDFDYDAERFQGALESWYETKRQVDDQKAKEEAEAKAAQDAWQERMAAYGKTKTELRVKDFDDAEAIVLESLSATQQGIIVQGAKNPALVVYALGKNPGKVKELAAIKDPIKYAFAVAELETQLKVNPRKAPLPESSSPRGSGAISAAVDSQLERLRNEAEKTGDYSKVIAYRNSKRASR